MAKAGGKAALENAAKLAEKVIPAMLKENEAQRSAFAGAGGAMPAGPGAADFNEMLKLIPKITDALTKADRLIQAQNAVLDGIDLPKPPKDDDETADYIDGLRTMIEDATSQNRGQSAAIQSLLDALKKAEKEGAGDDKDGAKRIKTAVAALDRAARAVDEQSKALAEARKALG